jgi:cytochrome c peroxidase
MNHFFVKMILLYSVFYFLGCNPDKPIAPVTDLTNIGYNPQAFTPNIPKGLPVFEVPADNPLTKEGIELGRKLFFDPILSKDSTIACASCHLPKFAFTDGKPVSAGVKGTLGVRSAMSLMNVAFYTRGLFWDNREKTLENQALLPVEDPVEMHENWGNVAQKLQRHKTYPSEFRKAFGIEKKEAITKLLVAKSLAQFERTLISTGNSKYDKVLRGELYFTETEQNGYDMFFDITPKSPNLPDAECFHCHNAPLFTDNTARNNGIQTAETLNDFRDKGIGNTTGKPFDNGNFRVPTLRNIALTAPYMHDGRFKTLDEVINHYASGGHPSPNKDPFLYPLKKFTPERKAELLAFLHTLTDTAFVNNPAFQTPFK